MKPSFYNYYIPYNSGMVFMNGITESSFWVPESRADTYRTIIECGVLKNIDGSEGLRL